MLNDLIVAVGVFGCKGIKKTAGHPVDDLNPNTGP
jgi:hypothetical protein